MNYESKHERDFISLLLADPSVEEIQEQPPAVVFYDDDGRERSHIFDFLVRRSGRRIAVDIKPSEKVQKSGAEHIQELIKEQLGASVADQFIVRTEQHLHPDDVHDAELIARARRLPDAVADKAVQELTSALAGRARIDAIVERTGLAAKAFNALVRLIGDRVLEVCDGARITPNATVRRCRG